MKPAFILIALIIFTACQSPSAPEPILNKQSPVDRNPAKLVYSKHARCRMACRHIDESEVQEILAKGHYNT